MQTHLSHTLPAVVLLNLIAIPVLAAEPILINQNMNPKPAMVQPLKKELVKPEAKPESNTLELPQDEIKNISKPADTPAPVMKPQIKLSKPSAADQRKATVPSAEIKNVPRDKLENANAVRQADQMRGLQDSKGLMDAARGVPGAPADEGGINRDLGLRDKGKDLSGLPGHDAGSGFEDPTGRIPGVGGNQDKGGAAGAPVRPGTDPAGWMGGAASQSRGGRSRMSSSILRGGSGGWSYDGLPRRDSQGRTHLRRDDGAIRILTPNPQGGDPSVFQKEPNRDGGFTVYRYHRQDGNVVRSEDHYNSAGERTGGFKWVNGRQVENPPQTGTDKTQDPDSADPDGSWARWHAKIMGPNPDLALKNPNQVNRGPDGAMSDPQAPRLDPGNELVTNPDPDAGNAQGGAPSQRAAEMMRQQMLDKAQGVTPGGNPGGAPSQQQMEGVGGSTR